MDIELGKPVMSRDDEQIGSVDRLIVDPEARIVKEFLIKEGTILTTDRVVDIERIVRIDGDGTIHLDIAAEDADSLPAFVESHYLPPDSHQINHMPEAWVGAHGGGPLIWSHTGRAPGEPGERSMFEPATVPSAPEQPESALADDSIVIDEGTNVVDRDGESFGTVEEVRYGPDGRISGFRVKSGTIFSSEFEIPMKWVDSMNPDAVRLAVTGEQAESAARTDG
jgi:uncharacterized protein YrrD